MKSPFVFLVGCPRSGTTLLKRMISAHPEIALVPEVRWLAQKYSSREGLTPDGRLTPAFFTQLRNLGRFSRVPLSPDELAELAANPSALTYAEFMTILYDAYGKARGKRLVGQKNADHAVPMDLDTVHALWPEAKVIHLIRDGRDVCLSVMNWRVQEAVARLFTTWGEHRVSTIAAWWEWQVRLMREAGNRIGAAQYREVHYDALVSNPEGTCTELCEFMGVPYDGAMLRFHENPPPRVREAKQSWLPPTPGRRNWRSEMAPEDVARFEAVAGDLLEQLGHPRGATGLPSTASATAATVRRAFELRPLPEHWSEAPVGQQPALF
ncbi:MAG: sulfotransferase family protein [Polyangiaceae bacterium]